MIVACDFDGTLCAPRVSGSNYRMGAPERGAVAAINHLVSTGHTIIIFTARNVQNQKVYQTVADWLDYFHIPYSGITNIKSPRFDVYIDDRALHFNKDWAQTLSDLSKYENEMQVKNYRITPPTPIEDITQPL